MRPGLLPRRYLYSNTPRKPRPCFNEAGAFAPEICGVAGKLARVAVVTASMRPGLLPRRYSQSAFSPFSPPLSFNEAGAFAPEILELLR